MKHHVLYVPGIRDDIYKVQSTAVKFWRLWGLHCRLHEIPWAGSDSYEVKFKRLLAAIDKQVAKGHTVSLVGVSAGASAVLEAYSVRADKINAVILVCGKVNRPQAVNSRVYSRNPAFKTAMSRLRTVLDQLTDADKSKMLVQYSSADRTVLYEDAHITGIAEQQLPAVSHLWAIVYSMTFGSRSIARFIKTRA